MTARIPLVLTSTGRAGELPTGNTLGGITGGGASGEALTYDQIGVNLAAHAAILAAIAALSATGLIARTGSGTVAARTIAGTSNQITVTNGDGVSGNPTLSLPPAITLFGSGTATKFDATDSGTTATYGRFANSNGDFRIGVQGNGDTQCGSLANTNCNLVANSATRFIANVNGNALVGGNSTAPSGATNNLVLSRSLASPTTSSVLGAPTADMGSLACVDKSAGDGRVRIQPEVGNWFGFGSGVLECQGAIGLQPNNLANGQSVNVDSLTELLTIAAAAFTDTTIQFPAGCIPLGASVRVTVAIPTATTFNVGNSTNATFWASGVNVAIDTTDKGTRHGADSVNPILTAQAVRITPSSTPATNVGRVRVTLHFLTITPPTS